MRIAFGYKARSGKDTLCTYLYKKYGGTIYHIAEPIYDILHYAQGIANLDTIKDRKFLQWIGTEWGRNINQDLWINILIEKVSNDSGNIFIADVRFINEFRMLKNNGFTLIKITREIDTDTNNHISETELDNCIDWDFTILNNGTLEELYLKIDDIL